MSEDSEVLKIVQEWIEKAENDIRNAVFTLTMRDRCPTDTVCFHAQQCDDGQTRDSWDEAYG